MGRHHPKPGSIPIPMPPQPDVGAFSGTPPPQFHPMNNPHMKPMTPEQHHIMAAMQQRAAEQHQQQQQQHQQQMEQQHIAQQMKMKQNQESITQLFAQISKGQNITMTPDQCAQFMQYCSMVSSQQQGANMMPGGQSVVPSPWVQQGASQQEMMMNHHLATQSATQSGGASPDCAPNADGTTHPSHVHATT